MGKHHDDDDDGLADRGEYEICDERPRDGDGNLLTGLPMLNDIEWAD